MPILYRTAKEVLARYAATGGLCADNPQVDLFTREVLDYMLISGHFGNIHKFCFCAVKGCFTIPYELEVPLKVKIDGVIGTVWDKFYEFHQTKVLDDCLPATAALWEDPNYYPTVYPVPDAGARVGVLGTCDESEDAHIIVQGIDTTGRQVITSHNGHQIVGEYLEIKKNCLLYTSAVFGEVTGIVKSPTVGWATLFWVNPALNLKGFMSDYSPIELSPSYRRFRITVPCRPEATKVSVVGKIRLREKYTDSDYIPFDNLYTLNLAGQAVNSNYNRNPNEAAAVDKQLTDIIGRDQSHHQVNNGQPVEQFLPLSAGNIGNIVYANPFKR